MQVVRPCLSQAAGLVEDNESIGEVMHKNVDLLQAFLKSLLMVMTSLSRGQTCVANQKHPKIFVS
jgi:hypothetical protein